MKPAPMSKPELLAVLDDMRAAVAAGDSFEGFIEYLTPTEGESGDFMVRASYRIGNTMGQGGVRMIGEM